VKTAYYKKEYCEKLIDHMSQGYSFESFGGVIRVGRRTLYDWCDKFKQFNEAKEIGSSLGKKYFETLLIAKMRGGGVAGLDTKKMDTTLIIFALKTRYRDTYHDKIEVQSEANISINIDNDDSKL
jgi:hypothetical protein